MMNRREFNQYLVLLSASTVGLGTIPMSAFAAWPTAAFDAETMEDATNALFGEGAPISSGDIVFKAPEIAENGAVVPISISTTIPNADHIALLVKENPSPLAVSFELPTPGPQASVSTRIKMGKTSELVALVRAEGKTYTATSNEVKVTIGGCGG